MDDRNKSLLNTIFIGEVASVQNYGAFISIPSSSSQGLVHRSQMSKVNVSDASEVVARGDKVWCKVISISDDGKIGLSMKMVDQGSGKDLDPNGVQLKLDEQKRKEWNPSTKRKTIMLDAVFNTTCSKCGTRGHLGKDCFQVAGGKTYELLPDDEGLGKESEATLSIHMASEESQKKIKKEKKKAKKKEKKLKKKKKKEAKKASKRKRSTSSSSSSSEGSSRSSCSHFSSSRKRDDSSANKVKSSHEANEASRSSKPNTSSLAKQKKYSFEPSPERRRTISQSTSTYPPQRRSRTRSRSPMSERKTGSKSKFPPPKYSSQNSRRSLSPAHSGRPRSRSPTRWRC